MPAGARSRSSYGSPRAFRLSASTQKRATTRPTCRSGKEFNHRLSSSDYLSSSEIQSTLRIVETFRRFETLIQWNGTHLVEAFEAPLKSQQKLLWSDWAARFAIHEAQRVSDGVPHLILNLTGDVEMTKTTKAMLAGAAFAGLFAGARAAVKASDLLTSLQNSLNAPDPDEDIDMQDKEKDACNVQNACKGKGGC